MTATLAPTTITADRRSAFTLGEDISAATDASQALTLAGLDWDTDIITPNHIDITSTHGIIRANMPEHLRFVTRSDTHDVIGVVGNRYTAVQNSTMADIAGHALAAGGVFNRAGALSGGSRVFMDIAFPGLDVKIAHLGSELDFVTMGLRIENAHDGSGHFQASITARRLACLNGAMASIQGLANRFQIRHTASAEGRLSEADRAVKGLIRYAKSFAATAQHLLDTPMTRNEFRDFIDALYPQPADDATTRETKTHGRLRGELMRLFELAETNRIGRNTAWGAFNSVTEYVDWVSPVRDTAGIGADNTRALRQFNGTGQAVKDRAMELLLTA